jgi:hypothetical protein
MKSAILAEYEITGRISAATLAQLTDESAEAGHQLYLSYRQQPNITFARALLADLSARYGGHTIVGTENNGRKRWSAEFGSTWVCGGRGVSQNDRFHATPTSGAKTGLAAGKMSYSSVSRNYVRVSSPP